VFFTVPGVVTAKPLRGRLRYCKSAERCYATAMSVRPPREVPTIGFDLESAFAGHHLVTTMCFPDTADRHPRLAAIGGDMADAVDNLYGAFLDDVARTLRYHGFPPPKEALEAIIDDCARDANIGAC